MSQAINVFISGVTGVFAGMGLLYISIKVMGVVADKIGDGKKEKKDA